MNWLVLVVFVFIASKCEGNYETFKNAYENIGNDDVKASSTIFKKIKDDLYQTCILTKCVEYKFEKSGWTGTYIDQEAKQDCYDTCEGYKTLFLLF